ncbi:NAD(P)-dependent oxidoreductase [Flavobacterium sp. ENC]|uniref:NAD(P)-dependent oxidoreductase n=1 Tax=Flavobacterium sp. ENC TaxID=2897330 RepID=UPI001E2E72DD|nr:NAD(P)H-binding protein [Flavobacterium sp. ENC]MCD0465111.1 NAD(P)H-binding protein [Flavobacterium sp. ENC]
MKIAVIGAGAGIGLQTVIQALQKGHTVTALSTNTSAMPDHELLTKINGSATTISDLKKAIKDSDAVLITVGTKNKKATTLFSDIAKALVTATAELKFLSPVLIITGFGSGESKKYLNFFMRTVIKLFLKEQYIDKTLMEEIIVNSAINWEIVRPGMLTNGPLITSCKSLPALEKGMKVGKISRAAVAHFLVNEAENKRYLMQFLTLTN